MTEFLLGFIFTALLVLVSSVQLLYLEALRLRTRETAALDYFKTILQDSLGYTTEEGSLVYSVIKHTLLVVIGASFVAATCMSGFTLMNIAEGFVIAFLVLIAGSYIIPHLLYRRSTGQWLTPLTPILRVLAIIFRPLTALMQFMESLYELSEPESDDDKPVSPAEEIEALISAGEEEGIIQKEDSRLIQSVVEFGDKRVREVMTPRRDIVAIEASKTLADLRVLVLNERFSRIPVYEETIDRIIGFAHIRDLYERNERPDTDPVRLLVRPMEGVPESKLAPELLREMQKAATHMVYVVDEYGNCAGLVTMEDLVEEIFGEIRDEYEPAHDIAQEPDGSITVAGSFDLDHLYELFDFRPDQELESTTVGGLVTEWLGEVPKAGATVERDGLRVTVLAADERRVERVRISRLDPTMEPEAQTA